MSVQKARQGYKLVKSLFGKYEEIPEEWEIKTIDNVNIKVIDGDRGEEYPKEHEFSKSGYCLFLSAKNVTKSGFLFDECSFISKNKDEKLRKGRLSRRDIVITTRGTVGNIAYFDENIPYEVIRINSGMAILQNNNEIVLQDFFYHLLKSQYITKQLTLFAFGSAQPQLTISIINSLKLIIPKKIEEQQKIASILSNVDSLINQTQKIIEQTQRLKKGLMQRLLTRGIGHTKFKKLDVIPRHITSEIPVEWGIKIMKKVLIGKTQNGINVKLENYGEGVPIFEIDSLYKSEFIIDQSNLRKVPIENKDELERYGLRENDLVINRVSKVKEGVGKMLLVLKPIKNLIYEGNMIRIRINEELLIPKFVEFFSKTNLYSKYMQSTCKTTSLTSIDQEIIEKTPIVIPSKNEQSQIIRILEHEDSQIQKQQEHKSKLETLKKGLMQKLLTGQRRTTCSY